MQRLSPKKQKAATLSGFATEPAHQGRAAGCQQLAEEIPAELKHTIIINKN
jgi:hypothetical protein